MALTVCCAYMAQMLARVFLHSLKHTVVLLSSELVIASNLERSLPNFLD